MANSLFVYFCALMNFRRFLVKYRIPLAVALMALGFLIGFKVSWWVGWIPMLVSLAFVAAYFLIGPMTLIQGYIEAGDMEGAQKLLDSVKFPQYLYKPVRSSYYMLRGNLATMGDDLDKAEADIKKSLAAGLPEKEYEGTAYLQLGSIAYKKGNSKEALEHLKQAVKIGLPDKDSEATAYLQLSSLSINRRDFRSAKNYYAKAKSCKSKNAQVVEQLNELGKYISRIPG